MILMLSPARQATFRRTSGKTQYVFDPRTHVEVPDSDLPGMTDDIGVSVVVPSYQKDSDGKPVNDAEGKPIPTIKMDHRATDELKVMLVEHRDQQRKKAIAAKAKKKPE